MLRSITLNFTQTGPMKIPVKGTTIFVGPNGSGKSLVLREIEHSSDRSPPPLNILELLEGDWPQPDEIDGWLQQFSSRKPRHQQHVKLWRAVPSGHEEAEYSLNEYNRFWARREEPAWWRIASNLFFRWGLVRLDGRGRFELTAPRSFSAIDAEPASALHTLLTNDELRYRLQQLVYDAFGKYPLVDFTTLGSLKVKVAATIPENERSFEAPMLDFWRSSPPIEEQSDGFQAFTGILTAVLAGSYHTLLIDEPEAFLHPPLARKLGRHLVSIAQERDGSLLAATHSSDFLLGCMDASDDVQIVRMSYRNGKSAAYHVDSERFRNFMRKPVMRSANVASALFHDGVVICEDDNDRVFYQEIYRRLAAIDPTMPSLLFLHTRNKQTIPEIVGPLRSFGIPAVGIVDIDVVKEGGAVWAKQLEAAGVPLARRSQMEIARKSVYDALKQANEKFKREGGIAVLSGGDLSTANRLFDDLDRDGLFVVRHGELESWLPELGVSANKATWSMAMLEHLGSDPFSPDYILPGDGDVWDFMRKLVAWIGDEGRDGMQRV